MESIKDKIHVIYEKYSKKPVNTLKRVVALMMAVFLAFSSYTGNWSVLGQKVYADDGEAETKSVDITIDRIPAGIKDEELKQGSFLLENAGRMYTGETVNIQQDAESQTKKYTVTFKGIDEADVKADGANPVIDFYKDNAEQTTYYEGWKKNVNDELKVEIPVDTDGNTVKYDKYKKVDITINDSDNIGLEASDFAVAVKKTDPDNTNNKITCILSDVNKTSLVYSALVKNPENEEYTVDVTINGQSQSAGNFEIDESSTYGTLTIRENAEKNITGNCIVKRKNADADYIIKVEDESRNAINDASVKLSYKTSDGEDNEVTTTNNSNGTYTASIKKGVSYKTVVEYNNYIQVSSNDYGEKNSQSETVTMKKKTYTVAKTVNNSEENMSEISFVIKDTDGNEYNDASELEFGKDYKVEISSSVKKIKLNNVTKSNDENELIECITQTNNDDTKEYIWKGTLNLSDNQETKTKYDNKIKIKFNITASDGEIKITTDGSTEVDNYNANSTMSIKSEPEAKSWKIEQDKREDNYEEITGNNAVIKIDTANNVSKLTISPQAKAGNKYKITAYADDNKKEAIASKEITISDYEQISLDNKNYYYKVVNNNDKEDVVNVTDNNTDIYYSASDVKIIAQKNAYYKWVPSGSESTFDSVEFAEMESGNNDKNTVATLSASTSGTLYVYEKLNDGKVYKGSIQIVLDKDAPKFTSVKVNEGEKWTQSKKIELTVSDNLSSSITDGVILNNYIYYVTDEKEISFLKNGDTYKNYYSLNENDKKTINSLSKLELNQSLNASLEVTENGTIHFIAIDKVGNISVEDVTVKNIDTTKPNISDIEISDSEKWTQSKTISLKVTDNLSGVEKLYVSESPFTQDLKDVTEEMLDDITVSKTVNNGNKIVNVDKENGTAEVKISQESESKNYYFYAIDNAGNVQKQEVTVKNIDTTKPNISDIKISDSEKWTQSKTISLKVTDNLSGVKKLYVSESPFTQDIKDVTEKMLDDITVSETVNSGNKIVNVNEKDGTAEIKISQESESKSYYFYAIDNAGNVREKEVKVTKIDKTIPKIKSITYENNIMTKHTGACKYHIFSIPQMNVVINVTDNLSGVKSLSYVKTDENNQPVTGVLNATEFANNDKKDVTFKLPIKSDFKGTIKFTAIDNSGNNSESKTTEGIIVESIDKHKETSKVEITESNKPDGDNDFYVSDFKIDIKAEDSYSGIKKIEYTIGDGTQEGDKFTEEFTDNDVYSWNKENIKVDASKHNGNKIPITVIMTDNTNHEVKQTKYYKIDTKNPEFTVEYFDENDNKIEGVNSDTIKYVNKKTYVKVTVDDYNFDNSDGEHVKLDVTKNDGKTVTEKLSFTQDKESEKTADDGTVYHKWSARYELNNDTDYLIKVSKCMDAAGNDACASDTYKTKKADKITIDKTAPDISVVYDSQAPANNYNNHDYYNVEKTVTITVKDLSFSADKDKVKVMLKKDGVDTQLASDFKEIAGYTTWENSNDTYKTYQMTYVIKDDADYAFTVECTDLAGNEDKYDRVDYFTIDKTSPVINVEYDNNTPSNIYDGHNYYNEQRTATITIDELSFNNDDVKVLVTKNNQTVAVQPAFNQIAGYTTRADSGDTYNTYQMTYAFDTDGDYTITVEYTDLAKNVDTYDRTDNFTVDMNGADIYVTYDNNQPSNTVDGYDYYNVTRTATVTIEELSFRNEDAHVIVTKNGNAVQVTPQFTETAGYQVRGNGNSYRTYQMTYLIDGDGDYTFTVDYTDLAGNADTYDRTDSFTIDKTRPEIRVTYDTDSPSNAFNNHDYYNVTRQATIAIDELSFNNSDVNVIVKKNNETVIVTPSFEEVTGLQTKDNGDTYRTYQMIYPFTEDADYTITVDYTDLAANTDEYDRTDSFTIDRSRPEIEVTYDNNTPSNSEGGKDYYNTQRTATVTVRELSFNNDDVQFIVTRDGASTVESPAFTEVAGLQTKDNGDTYRTYEMTYTFNDNFDYTVTADYTDLAGNSDNYDNVDEFTYDDIKPVISIELTGTSLESNEYFNDSRTATITVEEHNFNEAEFQLHMTATDNGTEIAAPSISGFAANGDTHTATIVFDRDEEITISADYTDMAGNVADTLNEQKFVIDLTDPEIEIEQDSLIENKTYGKDEAAMPKILITDTNFSQNGVSIQLEGRKNGLIQAAVASETVPNGLLYTVSGIDEDDVYTLTVNVTDMSGREQQYTRQFHVNRNGSSYAFGNALQTMNKTYVKAVGEDLYIVETNVDALTANKVTYSRGGMIAELKPETDYTVAVAENAYGWQEYTYRISQKVFSEEGEYKVILSSTDTAGNNSDNSSKEQAISFVVDNTPPTQVITGVEDDGVYTQDSLDVTIEVYDNVAVNSVDITLNGVKTTYNEEQITKENGKVYVNIPSDTKKQTLEVACIDYAGNEAQHQTYSFTVSTNAFIAFKARYLSKPGFWVAVGCVAVALAGAVTGTVVIRRRKKNVADN